MTVEDYVNLTVVEFKQVFQGGRGANKSLSRVYPGTQKFLELQSRTLKV